MVVVVFYECVPVLFVSCTDTMMDMSAHVQAVHTVQFTQLLPVVPHCFTDQEVAVMHQETQQSTSKDGEEQD